MYFNISNLFIEIDVPDFKEVVLTDRERFFKVVVKDVIVMKIDDKRFSFKFILSHFYQFVNQLIYTEFIIILP